MCPCDWSRGCIRRKTVHQLWRNFANKAKCCKEDIYRMDAISKPQVAHVPLTSRNEASYHIICPSLWLLNHFSYFIHACSNPSNLLHVHVNFLILSTKCENAVVAIKPDGCLDISRYFITVSMCISSVTWKTLSFIVSIIVVTINHLLWKMSLFFSK